MQASTFPASTHSYSLTKIKLASEVSFSYTFWRCGLHENPEEVGTQYCLAREESTEILSALTLILTMHFIGWNTLSQLLE